VKRGKREPRSEEGSWPRSVAGAAARPRHVSEGPWVSDDREVLRRPEEVALPRPMRTAAMRSTAISPGYRVACNT
jgi:hypothetical protein